MLFTHGVPAGGGDTGAGIAVPLFDQPAGSVLVGRIGLVVAGSVRLMLFGIEAGGGVP